MKTIHRLLGLAVVFSAALTANVAAQNPCDDTDGIAALDAKVRDNFKKLGTLEIAVNAAKQYAQKYGECEQAKALIDWFRPELPGWEKRVADYKEKLWLEERRAKFDESVKNKRHDEVYAVGAELVKRYPDNVHFMLPMALIGLPESYRNNYKYNDDTIKYAKMALAKLKSGAAEPKKDKDGKPFTDANGKTLFGPFQFERNAEHAISELTYALAYILYHAKKDKRAGVLYYYEVSQLPGPYKQEPRLYATIAQYYQDESAPIGKEIVALIEKQKLADTEEEKAKLDAEIKPKEALFNGYKQRATDALSRAYKFYDETVASEKAAKAQIYTELAKLLGVETKVALDKMVADASAKPFPNPASDVEPVSEPEPAKTADTPAPSKPAKGKPVKSKPAPRRKPRP